MGHLSKDLCNSHVTFMMIGLLIKAIDGILGYQNQGKEKEFNNEARDMLKL